MTPSHRQLLGDEIHGGVGNYITGGAAPGTLPSGLLSVYDEDGLRYDQFGNLLPEDDDVLLGAKGMTTRLGRA